MEAHPEGYRAGMTPPSAPRELEIGVVVIGRNEGTRLRVCLQSPYRRPLSIVHMDSGSIDGSVGMARELGADVLQLDMAVPFTTARTRNTGLRRLLSVVGN